MGTDDEVIVTTDFLDAGKSDAGAWNMAQLYCLGETWPPSKGWYSRVLDSRIPRELADEFYQLRNARRTFKAIMEIAERYGLPVICNRCRQARPVTDFDRSKRISRGRKASCRDCCKELSQEAKKRAAEFRATGPQRSLSHGYSYVSRGFWLSQMDFKTYREYLASDLWKDIRVRAFKTHGYRCFLCGERAFEVHHLRYHKNDLTGKRLKYLRPICRSCHQGIEFEGGKKQSVREAKTAFRQKRRSFLQDSETE